jgi:hypothetical protein
MSVTSQNRLSIDPPRPLLTHLHATLPPMSEPTDPDRDEEMLARLAEFDLAAAERVHGRLMAAEESSEIAELGRTYQRVARSLRQTLALKAKLKRDREAAAKDAPRRPAGGVAVARRLREVRQAVTRVIWNEIESPDEATDLEEALEDALTLDMLRDRFCDEQLDDHVARLCLDLDLSTEAAERWRDLPDPPEEEGEPPDEPGERRSSG